MLDCLIAKKFDWNAWKGEIMKDPAGIINLEELDRISEISGAGDGDVDPQSSPVIATILVSVISIEATVTAFSFTIEC